jgi:4-methyl-5(b-hydroxyethyl)-thiazole monophosphate biosynthesis
MSKRVLCLLVSGFEEIEAVAPIDLLRRAGAEVTIASLTGEKLVTGRCGVTVQADAALADVAAQEFDLLLIPGGPGVKALRSDGRPAQLARAYALAGKPVAAICAAPTGLADAGLLAGRRFTAHFSVKEELPQALARERVVEDGNLITSRGAGTAVEFGLALVQRLFGAGAAEEVAKAIMA